MERAVTLQVATAPRLSIVIPAVSTVDELEDTLVSVLENRPDGCEIIVALGCEYDDPWNIRDEVTFVRAPAGSSVIGCVNLGISCCTGEIVHVLSAGWKATEGWADRAIDRFDDRRVAAVVPVAVSGEDRDRVVSVGLSYTTGGRKMVRVPAKDCSRSSVAASVSADPQRGSEVVGPLIDAGFWRADVLSAAGPGFARCCGPAMADADLAVAI